MKSFTLHPIVVSTTRMRDRQDHDVIHADLEVESLARRFSSSRSLGSSIDMPGIGSSTEFNNSVAKRMRSASESERADLRIASCETDIRSSGKKKLKAKDIQIQNGPRAEDMR